MKIGTMNKGVVFGMVFLFVLLSYVGSVYAITGSIGNARMILRPELGETIERSILVKNVNDVPVEVQLSVDGDLAEHTELKEEVFTLQPGVEKKAFFTIKVKEEGTTETKINVRFAPLDGGNGVGLASTIFIIPEEGEGGSFFDFLKGDDSEDSEEQVDGEVSFGQKKNEDVSSEAGVEEETDEEGNGLGLMAVGGSFTIILFIALLVLLVVASKHMQKKRETTKSAKKSSKE